MLCVNVLAPVPFKEINPVSNVTELTKLARICRISTLWNQIVYGFVFWIINNTHNIRSVLYLQLRIDDMTKRRYNLTQKLSLKWTSLISSPRCFWKCVCSSVSGCNKEVSAVFHSLWSHALRRHASGSLTRSCSLKSGRSLGVYRSAFVSSHWLVGGGTLGVGLHASPAPGPFHWLTRNDVEASECFHFRCCRSVLKRKTGKFLRVITQFCCVFINRLSMLMT